MPYYITDQAEGCAGWATVKEDGEVMGCHTTKQDAIDQAVAIAVAEGSEFVGERSAEVASANLPGDDEQERYMVTPVEPRHEGSDVEFRTFSGELRAEGDGNTFVGYAAVFNSDSEPLPFTERILPGAFSRSLKSRKRDIRAYINHDSNLVLASTRSGTLRLTEDEVGLRAEFELPDTTYARDLSALMRDGIVEKMSFGFTVPRGGDKWSEDGRVRELREIALHEVSVVTGFPAYEATTAAVRSLEAVCERTGMSVDEVAQVLQRLADRPEQVVEQANPASVELKRRQMELQAKKVV